ncbi:hypothetical protein BB170200_03791 [Mycobacterium marinum]|nr:hypothetical protein BB170200_03791 [Mycobacterium marinum]
MVWWPRVHACAARGEGAHVLWGIDVVPVEQWVAHPSAGLAVAELICCGPASPMTS